MKFFSRNTDIIDLDATRMEVGKEFPAVAALHKKYEVDFEECLIKMHESIPDMSEQAQKRLLNCFCQIANTAEAVGYKEAARMTLTAIAELGGAGPEDAKEAEDTLKNMFPKWVP